MAILKDGSGEKPSVRAVAARAGVGASTLRHYFPTQRELLYTVLGAVYEGAMPDERIRDGSIPARERLIECVWRMLEPFGSDAEAREVWGTLFTTFFGPDATDDARAGYLVLARQADLRVESWLAILEDEGALPKGDNMQRAHFLLTVVDGLSIGRAFPGDDARLRAETATLTMAVEAVFATAAG